MVIKHFFKPLLPSFHSHLTIPVAFLKYIEGTNEYHTAKLRSDASKITWEVKIEDGRRLTDGWKEFALAHDLRIGDILIFRQEKEMAFHVTLMGPSCCEIQYESCSEEDNNLGNIPRKKKLKKNPRKETEAASLDSTCFGAYVSPATLGHDKLNLPRSFVRENGLETRCGEIVLMNEKGKSWTLALKQELCGSTHIRRGWRSFCIANGLKIGGVYTFKLIQRGRTPVLRLATTDSELEEVSSEGDEVESLSTEPESDEGTNTNFKKIQRKKNLKRDAESSSVDHSCYVVNVTPYSLQDDRLNLRKSFVTANGLDTRCGEIVLINEKGTSWTLILKPKNSCGTMYITRGWRSFCRVNRLRSGSSFTFKLIQRGETLALRKCPSSIESEGDEIESLSLESDSDKESNHYEKTFKEPRLTWKASSSPSQNLFVTLTLKHYDVKKSRLYLPVHFTRRHGISEETKMTMLDKNGVKWSTKLRSEKKSDGIRLVGGWKGFFKANCVEIGESIMLRLIWEGDTSCILKFCSKVKQDTRLNCF